jgi:hypothetical protein
VALGPRIAEDDLHDAIRQMAETLGWELAHFRKARTGKGWRTPVAGSLGKGWPDMVLVHVPLMRIIYAELKGDGGKVSPDQARVLNALKEAGAREVYVWTADDWRAGTVEATLR